MAKDFVPLGLEPTEGLLPLITKALDHSAMVAGAFDEASLFSAACTAILVKGPALKM